MSAYDDAVTSLREQARKTSIREGSANVRQYIAQLKYNGLDERQADLAAVDAGYMSLAWYIRKWRNEE